MCHQTTRWYTRDKMLSTAISSSLTDNCMYQVAEVCDTPVERVQCVACAFFAGFIVSVMLDRDGWRQVGIKRGSAKTRRHSPPPPYPPFSPSLISLMVSVDVKPVLNWANVCSPEHTSDTSTNYDSFLNWTFSSPNMVRTVQILLHSHLACNEMQASARTCGRQNDRKCRLKSSQYTLIIAHRVIQLTTISFWVSETRLRLPQVNK